MTTLLLEPFGGLAGDMLLAGLLDLDDPRFTLAGLRELAGCLVPGECTLATSRVTRGGLAGLALRVDTPESGAAPHRRCADLLELVAAAPLEAATRARVASCLARLAAAEGEAHGIAPDEVHFHEVGAVDTLIDVCGALWALERLGVTSVHATPPLVGEGRVHCAHGEMPVPAPGTAALLRGLPVQRGGGPGERLTPTGAAILAELVAPDPAAAFAATPTFVSERIGYGAGTRDPKSGAPNLLRVQLGSVVEAGRGQGVAWLLELNLDDTTGEEVGFLLDELRRAGALEAWTCAVQMKKGRPGVVVSALCRAAERGELERVVFAHTPTLGLRWQRYERTECERQHARVSVHGRSVRVVVRRSAGALRPADVSPEFDDLAELARASGRSLRELEAEVRQAYLDGE